jgi:hypothetical protein
MDAQQLGEFLEYGYEIAYIDGVAYNPDDVVQCRGCNVYTLEYRDETFRCMDCEKDWYEEQQEMNFRIDVQRGK